MPGTGRDGNPLHATLTAEVEEGGALMPDSSGGTITLFRAGGQQIAQAELSLMRSADDLGLRQPGVQPVTFVMAATNPATPLVENEPITGTAELRLNGKEVNVQLPETPLMFTH
jgi:hypothetical protein